MPVVTAMANAGWFRRLPPGPRLPSGSDTVLYPFIAPLAQALLGQIIPIFGVRPAKGQGSLGVCLPLSPRHGVWSRSSPFRSVTASIFASRECAWPRAKTVAGGIRCHGTELSMHGAPTQNIGQAVNLKHPHFSHFGSISCCSGLHQNCPKF
jgi:hypothetical protein